MYNPQFLHSICVVIVDVNFSIVESFVADLHALCNDVSHQVESLNLLTMICLRFELKLNLETCLKPIAHKPEFIEIFHRFVFVWTSRNLKLKAKKLMATNEFTFQKRESAHPRSQWLTTAIN